MGERKYPDLAPVRAQAEKNPFMVHAGIKIGTMEYDHVILYVDKAPELCNPYGILHGGVLYTMSDACAGMTARTDGRKYVTIDADMHYLRNISQGRATAESTLIRRGRTTCVVRVACRDEQGRLLTEAMVTMYCVGESTFEDSPPSTAR